MLTELPPGLLRESVCSFLDAADLKHIHESNKQISNETTGIVQMSDVEKAIFLHWCKLTCMDNDLSNLRQQFHELKCTKKRVRYMPNDTFASVIYKKVIYGPYFETWGRHGSWLFFFLDEAVGVEKLDFNVYKMSDITSNRYQLDPSSPFVTEKDMDMFRKLYDDQIGLCEETITLLQSYHIDRQPLEINNLRDNIEKTRKRYLS